MNNIQRLQMETKGIDLEQSELIVYLSENGLMPFNEYNATDRINTRSIYLTALSVLESLANNPSLMTAIKIDDMTVTKFHENLLDRIDQLERKINKIPNNNNENNGIFLFYN